MEDYDSEDSDGVGSTLSQTSQRSDYHIVMLGDVKIGKSALVSRFMDTEIFLKNYTETIVDQYKQLMFMLDNSGAKNRQVHLNVRDVGHRFLRPSLLEGQDCFVVCFSIANKDSFLTMQNICKTLPQKLMVIVGLKSDLNQSR